MNDFSIQRKRIQALFNKLDELDFEVFKLDNKQNFRPSSKNYKKILRIVNVPLITYIEEWDHEESGGGGGAG